MRPYLQAGGGPASFSAGASSPQKPPLPAASPPWRAPGGARPAPRPAAAFTADREAVRAAGGGVGTSGSSGGGVPGGVPGAGAAALPAAAAVPATFRAGGRPRRRAPSEPLWPGEAPSAAVDDDAPAAAAPGAAAAPARAPPLSPRSAQRAADAAAALGHCPWAPADHHLGTPALWEAIRADAAALAASEPALASHFHAAVLAQPSLGRALASLLANKLASPTLLGTQLARLLNDAYADDASLVDAAAADVQAVLDRDPACERPCQPLLFFKGFQALQAHRLAHWMWRRGRRALALALQSRVSEAFAVDIHPAATIGRGVMIDHGTGVVIGETAVVGDNVSMLHHVTLGGSGTGRGPRHPTVGNGVLLGAGVAVLGPVVVGHCTKVGAGSVVVTDLPPHAVAVGVPARVIKTLDAAAEPAREMDAVDDYIVDFVI